MKRSTLLTGGVLAAILVLVLLALMLEAASGPSFRPADYDSYAECMRNIPREWAPGSAPRTGAEDACMYVHRR